MKMIEYLKRSRIICRFIERLETIPSGVWRLFQACYNLIVLFLLIGGIAWGIRERKVLRENQRSMLINQDSMKAGIGKENLVLTDSLINIINND